VACPTCRWIADRYDVDPSRDHDSDALEPPIALRLKEPAEHSSVAVFDDPEGLAGVAVDEHGHIPVTPLQAGFVHQPGCGGSGAAAAATSSDQHRVIVIR